MMMKTPAWLKAYLMLVAVVLLFLLQPSGGTWAWLHNVRWLYVFIVAFLVTQLLVPVSIKIAWRFGILDRPGEARKLQDHPIPRIGGLAIFIAIIIAVGRNLYFSPQLQALMIAGCMIYIVGFFDDIRPLSATLRLAIQLLACFIVVNSGILITSVPDFPGHHYIQALVTVIWLLGMANAINFLDGIDGLVSSMSVVCALLFFVIGWHTRQSYLSYLTIAIAGGCAGFIPYNWRPATVYLGDAGATFLGFMLGGVAVLGSWGHNDPIVAVSTPLLILGIPIFDMIYTTVARINNGCVKNFKQWLEYAGRDHFHHRLMNLGLNVPQSVFFILLLNICLGLGAIVMRGTNTTHCVLLGVQGVLVFVIIVVLMVRGAETARGSDGE